MSDSMIERAAKDTPGVTVFDCSWLGGGAIHNCMFDTGRVQRDDYGTRDSDWLQNALREECAVIVGERIWLDKPFNIASGTNFTMSDCLFDCPEGFRSMDAVRFLRDGVLALGYPVSSMGDSTLEQL